MTLYFTRPAVELMLKLPLEHDAVKQLAADWLTLYLENKRLKRELALKKGECDENSDDASGV